MASMKVENDVNVKKKSQLNTTIDAEILNGFKGYCKEIGCPMNIILEAFMVQFANGEFTFKFGKSDKRVQIDIPDESTEE